MAADRREGEPTPDAGDGSPGTGELIRGTADPAAGALVVLRSGPRAGAGGGPFPAGGTDRLPELAPIEEEARDRFEVRVCRLRAAGDPGAGELALEALVRAPHRRAAFAAARWALAEARQRLGDPSPDGP